MAAHGAADAARQAALETKTPLLARMSGLETSLATLTQPSRDRAAALAQKVDAVTTMLKAMKGSAMPGAVLAFSSASPSAPPGSTCSPPWRAFAAERRRLHPGRSRVPALSPRPPVGNALALGSAPASRGRRAATLLRLPC